MSFLNDALLPGLSKAIKIYCCCDEKNQAFQEELESHFAAWKRLGQIVTWYNHEVKPGTNLKDEIDLHLNSANVILLLISHHFFRSDLCWEVMSRALQRHTDRNASVVPILVSAVDYEMTPIGKLQILPRSKPLSQWPKTTRDAAYVDIVRGVRDVVQTFQAQKLDSYGFVSSHYKQSDFIAMYGQDALSDPESPYFYIYKGDILFNSGRYEEALSTYQESIQRKNDFDLAYEKKAQVLMKLAQQSLEMIKQPSITQREELE